MRDDVSGAGRRAPRLDQFETAIREAWRQRHPGVRLDFAANDAWDGGYSTDPGDLDVFVFDAIYLDYFHRQGFLAPIRPDEVADPGDYLAYALEGSRVDGTLYGLPQLGYADILFFRRGDRELAEADGINTRVGAKRALALELANLMTSTAVMLASMGPTADAAEPQYLMPVRHSIFRRLAAEDPLYGRMYEMVERSSPRLFRIGPAAREWLAARKSAIRSQIFDAPSCESTPAG